MTLKNERHKALAMLVLSSMPLLLEMHGDILTFVDWHIIIPLLIYTVFMFKSTKSYSRTNNSATHAIFVCCAKSALCSTVFYAWMSLFFNLHRVLVKCLMVQSEGSPDLQLTSCQHNGIVTECLESLSFVNHIQLMSEKCPSSILGPSLGIVYISMIVFLRFIPTGIYGLWKLYVWDPKQFEQEGQDMGYYSGKCSNVPVHSPNAKILLGCTVVLLPCMMLGAALQDVMQLSHFTTAIPFLIIITIQYNMQKREYNNDTNIGLEQLMQTCMYVSIVYSISDFVINGLAIIKLCLGPETQSEETIHQCNGLEWSSSIDQCYKELSSMDTAFYSSTRCPKMGDTTTTIIYITNTLQMLVLTIGVFLAFMRQKSTGESKECPT